MQGRRLARGGLVLIGALTSLLVLSDLAAANPGVPVRSPRQSSVGTAALTGPPPEGGGAVTGLERATGTALTPTVSGPAVAPSSLSPTTHLSGGVVQQNNTSTDASATSGAATASNTGTVTAGGPGMQVGDNNLTLDQDANAHSGPAIAGSTVVGLDADPGDVQQTNNSSGATATSGPANATNVGTVTGGPGGGTLIGDNDITLIQTNEAESGPAIAGSSVVGSVSSLSVSSLGIAAEASPAHFSGFATPTFHSASFFDDPFFYRTRRTHFSSVSQADILRYEILSDMARDCLDRLASDYSSTLARICAHRLENLADTLGGFRSFGYPFITSSFFGAPFGDVFYSVGSTHIMSGFGGTASSIGGTHTMVGPLGVSVAGPGYAWSAGFGGWGFGFPVSSGGGVGNGALLFAPFGFFAPIFFSGSPIWVVDVNEEFFEDAVEEVQALFDRYLDIVAFQHESIVETIHFHSIHEAGWYYYGYPYFAPFSTTTFVADNAYMVSANHHWSSAYYFNEPLLDLPGITISANTRRHNHFTRVCDFEWFLGQWYLVCDHARSDFSRTTNFFFSTSNSHWTTNFWHRRGVTLDLPGITLAA